MEILLGIMFGLVAGIMARRVMPGPVAGGLAVAIPLGIGGALIGGVLGTFFTGSTATGFDVRTLLMAMFGSLLVLIFYRSYAMSGREETARL